MWLSWRKSWNPVQTPKTWNWNRWTFFCVPWTSLPSCFSCPPFSSYSSWQMSFSYLLFQASRCLCHCPQLQTNLKSLCPQPLLRRPRPRPSTGWAPEHQPNQQQQVGAATTAVSDLLHPYVNHEHNMTHISICIMNVCARYKLIFIVI